MKKHFIKLLNFIRLNFEKIKDFLEKKENTSLKDIVNDHIDNEREFSIEEKEMLTNIIGFGRRFRHYLIFGGAIAHSK